MKTFLASILIGVLLIGTGCGKKPVRAVLKDGLAASMSDEQILRVLQLDPAKLQARREHGPDGYSIIYTDAAHEVWITRSVVSGVIVMRMKPERQLRIWELGKS